MKPEKHLCSFYNKTAEFVNKPDQPAVRGDHLTWLLLSLGRMHSKRMQLPAGSLKMKARMRAEKTDERTGVNGWSS